MKSMPSPTTIDAYIAQFPPATQKLLEQVRAVIRKEVPDAGEKIGYGIPTFTLHGNLVHFAGYKEHIGFYPGAAGIAQFEKEIAKYKWAKGSVQFPLDQPIPFDLIRKITAFRVKQNMEKTGNKSAAKKTKTAKGTLKVCPKGHQYYKSSDCPTCPICEEARAPKKGFLSLLSAPARRALESKGISSLKQLAKHTEKDILSLHGMGPASLPVLKKALKGEGLAFKK